MKTPKSAKTTHELPIADAIWDAYEVMASDMGSDREGLINQALFMFARLNGYLMPTAVGAAVQIPSGVPQMPTITPRAAAVSDTPVPSKPAADAQKDEVLPPEEDKTPLPPPQSEEAAFESDFEEQFEAESPAEDEPPQADEPAEEVKAPEKPRRAAPPPEEEEVIPPEDEEDEFLKEDSPPPPPPRRSSLPPPPPRRSRMSVRSSEPEEEPEEEQPQPETDDRKAVAERVLETAAELERLIKGGKEEEPEDVQEEEPAMEEPPEPKSRRPGLKPRQSAQLKLYMVNQDGDLEPIEKSRYIIGRGKHCDMVINSGKVSREHAVITHENGAFFIEDLGSSNGTWFKKQRIKKQQIEDGDEFFICSEKVVFAIR